MLKQGLKLDRVHTYQDISHSQLEEKITWIIEMTASSLTSYKQLQKKLALVVIINIGERGYFLESDKNHQSEESYSYADVNRYFGSRPQNFTTAGKDLSYPFKNYMEI